MSSRLGSTARALAVVALVVSALAALPSPAAAQGCTAIPSWFSGIPPVPANQPQTVCQFEQWAWQSFLGLLGTNAAQPTALFLTWPLPKDTMSIDYCVRGCGTPKGPKVTLRGLCQGAATDEVANATEQPGFSPLVGSTSGTGELIDQRGNVVFIGAHVSPAWVDFIERRQLYNGTVLANANPLLSFHVGSFEVKTAWRSTAGMSPAEKATYFTAPVCQIVDNKHTATVEMALVGFHIIGGAPNHPEQIWATFEHRFNAPDCQLTPAPGTWSFYDGKTNCRTTPCNVSATAANPSAKTTVCRVSPFGGANAQVATQIAQLNADVRAKLPAGSVLRNYDLVGTVWSSDPLPSNAVALNLQDPAGSPLLANTTLETYKQGVSCFGCHNTQFPGELALAGG
ncbi:MAG TPA: hypothetical protein VGE98_06895, partial [Thermoanaerobaculia bacterium]